MTHGRFSFAWRGLLWRCLLSLVLVLTGTTGAGGRTAVKGAARPSVAHGCHGGTEQTAPTTPSPSAPCCADHACHCGCLPVGSPTVALRLHVPGPELTRTAEALAWPLDSRPSVLLRPPNTPRT